MRITFDNHVQAVLYRRFILPAMVTGPWKNGPKNHHSPWLQAEVHVRPPTGRDFPVPKDGYNVLRLIHLQGLEMRAAAYYALMEGEVAGMSIQLSPENIIESALDTAFTDAQLRAELREIKRIMKRYVGKDPDAPELPLGDLETDEPDTGGDTPAVGSDGSLAARMDVAQQVHPDDHSDQPKGINNDQSSSIPAEDQDPRPSTPGPT